MDLIAFVFLASVTPSATLDASVIILTLIPFIVVGCVVGAVYVLRRRQKRRMRDV